MRRPDGLLGDTAVRRICQGCKLLSIQRFYNRMNIWTVRDPRALIRKRRIAIKILSVESYHKDRTRDSKDRSVIKTNNLFAKAYVVFWLIGKYRDLT